MAYISYVMLIQTKAFTPISLKRNIYMYKETHSETSEIDLKKQKQIMNTIQNENTCIGCSGFSMTFEVAKI